MSSILVIFGENRPQKPKKWFEQFDEVLGPKESERFIDSGSVQEACELVDKLSRLRTSDGRRLPKIITYEGYELWWMHYDDLYDKFCLPYTKFRRLLDYLKGFSKICLYQAPYPILFSYFLKAHHCQCFIMKKLPHLPFGNLIQLILSMVFLPWLMITRPRFMVFIGDRFDPPHDFDFRDRFIYEELRKRGATFVEFIRSLRPWLELLAHAWRRKRPVIYSTAIIDSLHSLAGLLGKKKLTGLPSFSKANPEEYFWFQVATDYLQDIKGTIWSIKTMKFILEWIGVRAAIIPSAGCNRTFHETLACKLAGIKTVGIQHGAASCYYAVADFMPGFDGKLSLSVDRYGLWSQWWKEYYLAHGRAFGPEQLAVSGPMRPLEKKMVSVNELKSKEGPLRVLFISEQLAAPQEIMPYLSALLAAEDFSTCLKFRPSGDGFEEWLKQNRPDILERITILRGNIHEAIRNCEVVVGSHSTSVLEGLLQLKPFVFFRTGEWGDYFDIKSFDAQGKFFAENPEDLIDKIRKSVNIPQEDLKVLQEQFFGDPYQNGSQWAVEQVIKYAQQ